MKNCLLIIFTIHLSSIVCSKPSQCYGTTSNGRIDYAKQLPVEGDNFVIYNSFGQFFGRNYIHSKVYNVIIESFADLNKNYPDIKFKYAETGWKNGGEFEPHKTHQNGLSVDFMVPVIDENGDSVYFSTTIGNKFGYGVDFDERGTYHNFTIDYESLAAHIIALDESAKKLGIKLNRVIFAPELRQFLFKTSSGEYLKKNVTFMKNKAWVRHDEHYHVDFDVLCTLKE